MLKRLLSPRMLLRILKTRSMIQQLEELPSTLKSLLLLEERICLRAKLHQKVRHQPGVTSQNQFKERLGSIWSHSCSQELPNPPKDASSKRWSQPKKKVLRELRDPKLHQLREPKVPLKSQLWSLKNATHIWSSRLLYLRLLTQQLTLEPFQDQPISPETLWLTCQQYSQQWTMLSSTTNKVSPVLSMRSLWSIKECSKEKKIAQVLSALLAKEQSSLQLVTWTIRES